MFSKKHNLVTLLELTEAFHEIRQLTVAKRVTIYPGKEGKMKGNSCLYSFSVR